MPAGMLEIIMTARCCSAWKHMCPVDHKLACAAISVHIAFSLVSLLSTEQTPHYNEAKKCVHVVGHKASASDSLHAAAVLSCRQTQAPAICFFLMPLLQICNSRVGTSKGASLHAYTGVCSIPVQ